MTHHDIVCVRSGGAHGDEIPRGSEAEGGEGQERRALQSPTDRLLHCQGGPSLLEQC